MLDCDWSSDVCSSDLKPVDAMTSATPYSIHEKPPQLTGLTALEKRGETLFQGNCAFCHAPDGTARNWIGSFLQPHPRNLTDPAIMASMTKTRLRTVINEGLPGTSMPAWKSVLSEQDIEAVIAYVNRAFHPINPE
jgi:cytochrome c oxidase cbb3-type subunit 3